MEGRVEAVPFEKLNFHNWSDWSRKVKAWLIGEGLWEATQHARAATPTAEQLRTDQRAYAALVLSIENSQLPHVEGLETAHDVWEALRRVHLRPTLGSKVNAFRTLANLRLQPGASVEKHVTRMLGLFATLHDLEIPFSEEQQVFTLLSSLDESYDTLSQALLESVPQQDLTLHYVSCRLIDEEARRQSKGAPEPRGGCPAEREEGDGTAFQTRRCFRCNSKNHLIKDCPQ